jgi:hypothetical protein
MTQFAFFGQMLPHQYFNVEYFFSSAFRFLICNRSFIDLYVASWKCVVAQQRHIFCRVGEREGGKGGRNRGWKEGRVKCKAVLLQAWSGPEGSRKIRFTDYMATAQDGGKVVSLTHRPPLPPGNAPGTHFC